jgi:hypothetical protein
MNFPIKARYLAVLPCLVVALWRCGSSDKDTETVDGNGGVPTASAIKDWDGLDDFSNSSFEIEDVE